MIWHINYQSCPFKTITVLIILLAVPFRLLSSEENGEDPSLHGIHDEFSHDQLKRGERLFYGLIPIGEDARSCADCHNTDEHSKSAGIPAAGVCLNCHRDTEVQFIDNAFYEKYEKLHEEL